MIPHSFCLNYRPRFRSGNYLMFGFVIVDLFFFVEHQIIAKSNKA